jgi:hypothetical protein|uniref:Uncharacterized protein n=1 Tax=viral metagenome TaxID=1070528 RepID=A0A6C0E5W4_9ZZZZ
MENNSENKNFIKHVFNFEDDSKSEILNILQYALIAIIPVVLLNKTMAKYVPEVDENKGSLEVSAEIILQVTIMFIGLLLIHRMITFVPTYSGVRYPEFNIIFIILSVLMITLSLQTRLGEKVSVLFDRVVELWDGSSKDKKPKKKSNVRVSQPISGQQSGQPQFNDGTSIMALPTNPSQQPQQQTNYNGMYQQDNTPLVGANAPATEMYNEPVAANAGFGGFSSW